MVQLCCLYAKTFFAAVQFFSLAGKFACLRQIYEPGDPYSAWLSEHRSQATGIRFNTCRKMVCRLACFFSIFMFNSSRASRTVGTFFGSCPSRRKERAMVRRFRFSSYFSLESNATCSSALNAPTVFVSTSSPDDRIEGRPDRSAWVLAVLRGSHLRSIHLHGSAALLFQRTSTRPIAAVHS